MLHVLSKQVHISQSWPSLLLLCFSLLGSAVYAESETAVKLSDAAKAVITETAEVEPIQELINQRVKSEAELEALKTAVQKNKDGDNDEIEHAELLERIKEKQAELSTLAGQIAVLATGVDDSEFQAQAVTSLDIKAEAEQLLMPFISMLRSATDEARQTDALQRELAESQRRQQLASNALANIEEQTAAEGLSPDIKAEMEELKNLWAERLNNAKGQQSSVERQLLQLAKQKEQEATNPAETVGHFFVDRGFSLLLGFGSFTLVLGLLFCVAWLAGKLRKRRGIRRNFRVRLCFLLYMLFAFVAATVVMLAVFNLRNDWFLLGISVIVVIALSWFGIKLLPELIEQIVLYLDLGAVQEGERLMFNGIPWTVSKLAWHTDLVNPALECGTFTLPIRELTGLHSRPTSQHEHWFPTEKGDWVLLDAGLGRVVFQSPEVVQVVLLGGIRHSISAPEFYAAPPPNISFGSRVEVTFGIAYQHQAIATTEIPERLAQHVQQGLLQLLSPEQLNNVAVEVLEAADSAITYEVEADITGEAAHLYEDVERALARLCIEACNENGWEIPFPQLVLHNAPK